MKKTFELVKAITIILAAAIACVFGVIVLGAIARGLVWAVTTGYNLF